MASYWALLLLAGLIMAVPLQVPKTTKEVLDRFIALYNKGPNVQNLFRVLQSRPQPEQTTSSGTIQPLNFTIQETVCPASKKVALEKCQFKPDGLVKDCSGYFTRKQTDSHLTVSCDPAIQGPVRNTRAFGFILNAIKGLFRG